MKKKFLIFVILLFTTVVLYSEASLNYSVLETANNISFSLNKKDNSNILEQSENESIIRHEATFGKGLRNIAIFFLIYGILKISSRKKHVNLNILFNSN